MGLSDNVTAVLLPTHQLFARPPANFVEGNKRCAPSPRPNSPHITKATPSTLGAASSPPRPHNPPSCPQQLTKIQLVSRFPHAPCRYPYSNAVRSLSCALSATTRSRGFCNSLNKTYENRGHPAPTTIVQGLDVDSHAVGLPSSESRSFVRGGACPLQWLPVLLAVVDMPPSPRDPLPPSIRTDHTGVKFDAGVGELPDPEQSIIIISEDQDILTETAGQTLHTGSIGSIRLLTTVDVETLPTFDHRAEARLVPRPSGGDSKDSRMRRKAMEMPSPSPSPDPSPGPSAFATAGYGSSWGPGSCPA